MGDSISLPCWWQRASMHSTCALGSGGRKVQAYVVAAESVSSHVEGVAGSVEHDWPEATG